jgi:uncharacterized protein
MLSVIPDLSTIQSIVEDMYAANRTLLSVSGIAAEAQTFAAAWEMLSGQSSDLKLQLRFYQLDAAQRVLRVKGHLRLAENSDRALLTQWFEAFSHEVIVDRSESVEQRVAAQLSQKALYIWQHHVPVSLVSTDLTASGNGIGSVYTPPEHRSNGYATASVAAVSQILLDRACKSCHLSTNLKKSTSNHIYQTAGYQPVYDQHRYTFE